MTTSDVKITPGTGENIATNSITEDAETKKLQRMVLNKSDGTELGTTGAPIQAAIPDGSDVTLGAKADAKSTATDTTAASLIAILKQISYNLQIAYPSGKIDKMINSTATLVATTATTVSPSTTGFTPVELEIVNVDGASWIRFTLDGTTPSATVGDILVAAPGAVSVPWNTANPTVKLYSAGTPVYQVTVRGY